MLSSSYGSKGARRRWSGAGLFCLLAAGAAAACEPDLDSLTAGIGQGGGAGDVATETCSDRVQQPEESAVDCGGTSLCARCANDLACSANSDCQSEYCREGLCKAPRCDDGAQNGTESDVDCGGICAPLLTCGLGAGCSSARDCQSQYCQDGKCADQCKNGTQDGDETGVDCGGPACSKCATGSGCEQPSDCHTGLCLQNACAEPACTDQIQNQDETGVDCGGVCAASKGCADGLACRVNDDCRSFLCAALECVSDDAVTAVDWIDTFEDGDTRVEAVAGRQGNWYMYGDEYGTRTYGVEEFTGRTLPGSMKSMHTVGSDHSRWGAGIGVDLNNATNDEATKRPYDASAYSGITFWARSEQSMTITVLFPDELTDPNQGKCVSPVCDDHFSATVTIGTSWAKHTVAFSSLRRGNAGAPATFSKAAVVGIQFRAPTNATYNFWLDNLAFRR